MPLTHKVKTAGFFKNWHWLIPSSNQSPQSGNVSLFSRRVRRSHAFFRCVQPSAGLSRVVPLRVALAALLLPLLS